MLEIQPPRGYYKRQNEKMKENLSALTFHIPILTNLLYHALQFILFLLEMAYFLFFSLWPVLLLSVPIVVTVQAFYRPTIFVPLIVAYSMFYLRRGKDALTGGWEVSGVRFNVQFLNLIFGP
jgi:hypothetical protein